MNPRGQIGRLIFLTTHTTIDKEMCVTIAKQLDIPAQVGDCLAAVEIIEPSRLGGKPKSNVTSTGLPPLDSACRRDKAEHNDIVSLISGQKGGKVKNG